MRFGSHPRGECADYADRQAVLRIVPALTSWVLTDRIELPVKPAPRSE